MSELFNRLRTDTSSRLTALERTDSMSPNLVEASGRLQDRSAATSATQPRPFQNSAWTSVYSQNGGTVADAGTFLHNNSNFGGSAGVMSQTVEDLCNFAGLGRHGVSFSVAEFTQGGGTAAAGLLLYSASLIPALFSARLFFRVVSGSASVPGSLAAAGQLFVDDVQAGSGALPSDNAWHHLAFTGRQNPAPANQYDAGTVFYFRATPGAVVQIAMPAVVAGRVQFTKADRIILSASAEDRR